jgi:hypothetical protein
MMNDRSSLSDQLQAYGAPPGSVLSLDVVPQPKHIAYLDLVRDTTPVDVRPEAVVESQGRPILFVVRERPTLQLPRLQRVLALRSDGSFLGVLEPGRLTVYSTSLVPDAARKLREIRATDPGASDVIPELALRPPSLEESTEIHRLLFRLFDHATTTMTENGVSAQDALSLAGRAVFLRFLVDRGIARNEDVRQVCAAAERYEDCFANPANVISTSTWLDLTFNGDLLPLSGRMDHGRAFFSSLPVDSFAKICSTLTKIMRRAEPSGQMRLDWSGLDFAHIPVGLLSQVYEDHTEKHHPTTKKKTSVYYTPRTIAEYMVDEAFAALVSPHTARVLDPAAGAGVFLVTALRKLVEERWRHDGKRPNTAIIREILNRQLAGFEINESALRLCAFSLYLTAVELDPQPRPVQQLRFDKLLGSVLFDVSGGLNPPYVPGSLGPDVGTVHQGRYDLVIGNPPWTPLRRERSAQTYRDTVLTSVRAAVTDRLGPDRAAQFTLPDDDPDIAFCWRATEWAKPSGVIAFAMHGRLLFKQSRGGRAARAELIDGVHVTGILNGAAVRQTEVWPRVAAPFCLVFAKNELPIPDSTFYFVTVEYEESLNRRGRVRVDAKAARVVSNKAAKETPDLLKTLFRGTALDVALVHKIRTNAPKSLLSYWKQHALQHGDGFQVGGEAGEQKSAAKLHDLPMLTEEHLPVDYLVRTAGLPQLTHKTLLRTRRRELYCAPIVLIAQAPDMRHGTPRASVVKNDLAFTESFIGYSCAGHPDAEALAYYLFLLFNSSLPLYIALMTSGQFGVERDVYLLDDIKQQPFRPIEDLSAEQRSDMLRLANDLLKGHKVLWDNVDSWAADVYGLNKWDRELFADALRTSAPSNEARAYAQARPTRSSMTTFATRLAAELRPFLLAAGAPAPTVTPLSSSIADQWLWLTVASASITPPNTIGIGAVGDDLGATQIFACRPGLLQIGILGQNRYWTRTRARLLALDILQHEDLLRALTTTDA